MSASTTAVDPVQAVIDLLDGEPDASWTGDAPNIYEYEAIPQNEKGPGADMPPELYVLNPTESSHPPLSGYDYEHFDSTFTVVVQAWALSDGVVSINNDIKTILGQYGNDNEDRTPFHRIRPTNSNDWSEQTNPRNTDYYLGDVTVELRRLSSI